MLQGLSGHGAVAALMEGQRSSDGQDAWERLVQKDTEGKLVLPERVKGVILRHDKTHGIKPQQKHATWPAFVPLGRGIDPDLGGRHETLLNCGAARKLDNRRSCCKGSFACNGGGGWHHNANCIKLEKEQRDPPPKLAIEYLLVDRKRAKQVYKNYFDRVGSRVDAPRSLKKRRRPHRRKSQLFTNETSQCVPGDRAIFDQLEKNLAVMVDTNTYCANNTGVPYLLPSSLFRTVHGLEDSLDRTAQHLFNGLSGCAAYEQELIRRGMARPRQAWMQPRRAHVEPSDTPSNLEMRTRFAPDLQASAAIPFPARWLNIKHE